MKKGSRCNLVDVELNIQIVVLNDLVCSIEKVVKQCYVVVRVGGVVTRALQSETTYSDHGRLLRY